MKNNQISSHERVDELGINDLKVIQNTNYFCFGFDSVLLANFVAENSSKNVVMDLCSGSGVIPILLSAKIRAKKFFAVEMQEQMYDLLYRNISNNNLGNMIYAINYDIKKVEKLRKILINETGRDTADIITVNPPYKKVGTGIVNKNSVNYLARYEELCSLEDVFKTVKNLLNDKGKLYIVHKPERLTDLMVLARKNMLEPKKIRFVYPKKDSKPSIVLIQYSKNGGNEVNVLPPLIEYEDSGEYTDEIYELYGWKGEKIDE